MKTGKNSWPWRLLNWTLIATLAVMVFLTFLNACLRYAFNSGIPEGEELSRYLFVWISALGAIVAFKENRHIGVDFLLSALKGKPKKALVVIGQSLVLIAFCMVLWGGWEYFLTSAASPGPATDIPFGFVSVSIIVVSLAIIAMTARNLAAAFRQKD